MSANRKIVLFVLVAVLLVIAGIWLGRPPATRAPEPIADFVVDSPSAPAAPVKPIEPRPLTPRPVTPTVVTNTPVGELIVEWDEQIEEILHLDEDDKQIARRLLALLPRLPDEGRVDAIQHAANLLDDDDYAPLLQVLTDTTQPAEVLDELIADLLNRPTSVMLPALLEVAKKPEHPNAEEAKDYLELYLDEDYGTDWRTWEQKMKEWLAENPD